MLKNTTNIAFAKLLHRAPRKLLIYSSCFSNTISTSQCLVIVYR